MAVLPLIYWPDDRLSAASDPIAPDEQVGRLASDMFDTMYAASGRGLAAPQIGRHKRLCVLDLGWKNGSPEPRVFVNPSVIETAETLVVDTEVCLSIPGVSAPVPRPDWVRVSWRDLHGTEHSQKFEGVAARCLQHEIDHLDGVVTLHRLDEDARARALADSGSSA